MATISAPVAAAELGVLLEELRAAQPGRVLAEQRHQFLDLDPDLVREDYTRPAGFRVERPVRVPAWSLAVLSRSCCDWTVGGRGKGATAAARWKVFVSLPGSVANWPEHRWPASRRYTVPTPAERAGALASLGWQVAPGETWGWSEDAGADFHGHPAGVDLLASVQVVPLVGAGVRA
ncbi:DUF6303 family protein [Streptomyces sp. NPDC051173]|uniref:DUF6303 family protein n=1 Tax=Streptomyces sp. NPDC051173 TaxID=3155164 RepID=UPI00344EA381